MLWNKKEVTVDVKTLAEAVAAEAEALYRSGKMHCAESVLASVRQHMAPHLPAEVVQVAGGFGGGSGAGCICGAVAGGTMAFGLLLQGDKKRIGPLTKELHGWFKKEYGATCCKVLTAKGKGGCLNLTARVAGKVAELLAGEGVRLP